ncbi:MAG: hypothetical protein HY834_01920 [Devosia nanyangense]|uniref:Uncharacterized protein n=1 Tax=Devosia nanyangense TaxID=1228055 RepID=A0A933NV50_9HYPH|nr:hypothetical protein [Devosia nanyangense]
MAVETPVHPHSAGFWPIVLKTAIVHTATYFVMGLLALYLFDYATVFTQGPEAAYMRPTTDPWVAAGPLFQPIRGVLFGIVFYLLREVLFAKPRGWLIAWAMLAIVGIINPFAAAQGSIEGLVYLSTPLSSQFGLGLIEVYGQSLLLALGTFYWVRQPANRWLTWGFSIVATLAVAASLAGIFLAPLAKTVA